MDEVPPVKCNNMDVSNLLIRIECLHSEVCALRHAIQLQVDNGENLHKATTSIDSRVTVIERHLELSQSGGIGLELTPSRAGVGAGALAVNASARVLGANAAVPISPKWTKMVKNG